MQIKRILFIVLIRLLSENNTYNYNWIPLDVNFIYLFIKS